MNIFIHHCMADNKVHILEVEVLLIL